MDIIAKNVEMNTLIKNGVKVSRVDSEVNRYGSLDRSFYRIDDVAIHADIHSKEQAKIEECYQNTISDYKQKAIDLTFKQQSTELSLDEKNELKKAIAFSTNEKSQKTLKQKIAKFIRNDKSTKSLDEVMKAQVEEAREYCKSINEEFKQSFKSEQVQDFNIGVDLNKKELEDILANVLKNEPTLSLLALKAYIAMEHKGRFTNKELDIQIKNAIEYELLVDLKQHDTNGMGLFTSTEKIVSELHFKETIKKLHAKKQDKIYTNDEAKLKVKMINAKLPEDKQLNAKQQESIIKALTSTSSILNLVAPAGSGKTTATINPILQNLKALNPNTKIYGGAIADAATKVLQKEINADKGENIRKLVMGLTNGKIKLKADDIVVIDEYSMVGLEDGRIIADAVEKAGCRLITIGDPNQLQAIASQNPQKIVIDTLKEVDLDGTAQLALSEIVRQQKLEQKQLVANLESNLALDIKQTRAMLEANKQVTYANNDIEAQSKCIKMYFDYLQNGGTPKDTKIYTYMVDDVITFNNQIVNRLIKEGKLNADKSIDVTYSKGNDDAGATKEYSFTLYNNQEVMLKQNTKGLVTTDGKKIDVSNGTALKIVDIDGSKLILEMEDKTRFEYDTKKHQSLVGNYSQSIHSSQGSTVKNSIGYFTSASNRTLALIDLSRGKEDNHMVFSGDATELDKMLAKTTNKQNLIDFMDKDILKKFQDKYLTATELAQQKTFKDILDNINPIKIAENIANKHITNDSEIVAKGINKPTSWISSIKDKSSEMYQSYKHGKLINEILDKPTRQITNVELFTHPEVLDHFVKNNLLTKNTYNMEKLADSIVNNFNSKVVTLDSIKTIMANTKDISKYFNNLGEDKKVIEKILNTIDDAVNKPETCKHLKEYITDKKTVTEYAKSEIVKQELQAKQIEDAKIAKIESDTRLAVEAKSDPKKLQELADSGFDMNHTIFKFTFHNMPSECRRKLIDNGFRDNDLSDNNKILYRAYADIQIDKHINHKQIDNNGAGKIIEAIKTMDEKNRLKLQQKAEANKHLERQQALLKVNKGQYQGPSM